MHSSLTQNIRDILSQVYQHQAPHKALLIYDFQSPLSTLLAKAYQQVLSNDLHLNFDEAGPEKCLEEINKLNPLDLVILVQSTSFRLDAFRIRVHLFKQGLKVIEHPHVGRVLDHEIEYYVNSLAYNSDYYQKTGAVLKERLDAARKVEVKFGSHSLLYEGPFEEAKQNIGDFSKLKNKGSQFPIGEVFSELKDLTKLNGEVLLFAFGDRKFGVYDATQSPILLKVKQGRVCEVKNSNPEFDAVLQEIKDHEEEVWLRELGLGLNKAFNRTQQIRHDVGIYERMCGVHISLGAKHALYPKQGFNKKEVKYHVDVFAEVDEVLIDEIAVFQNGNYRI